MSLLFKDFNNCYCYETNCPARTKEKPYPYSSVVSIDEEKDCPHCGNKMTVAVGMSDGGDY